jgi:hypothetical protein
MKKLVLASLFVVAGLQPVLAADSSQLCGKGTKVCACGQLPAPCGNAATSGRSATVRAASPIANTNGVRCVKIYLASCAVRGVRDNFWLPRADDLPQALAFSHPTLMRIRDANGQALAFVYCEDETGRAAI